MSTDSLQDLNDLIVIRSRLIGDVRISENINRVRFETQKKLREFDCIYPEINKSWSQSEGRDAR